MSYTDLKEKIIHGSPGFPVQYYTVDSHHPRYNMLLHWHKEFEIIKVSSGSIEVFINNAPYRINQGDIVMVNCGCLHRGIPKDCTYECFLFDLKMLHKSSVDSLSKYIFPLVNHSVTVRPLFLKDSGDQKIIDIVNDIFDIVKEEKEFYELKLFSLLFSLFSSLYNNGDIIKILDSSREKKQLQSMSVLLDWIENHFKEPISLSDLARVSGMNEKYICKLFKKYTAQTPIENINRLRIESASRGILYENLSITEAALDNGFNDLSYFSKTFKKIKGISPNLFKKMHSNY